eukprot:CAMPEP_0196256484 /NCGR_PEP_ID=MMETSP0913-20130531/55872_1 /TAXON_ID=49265 /ORGANISM="Thalassiosira rotula, Strain GSO102" /LENGTH=181 /DNA_ID=CAMNT_0041543999 /DNA_START=33 /DNA_END=578 /DNA_ORIENTATION=+
MVRFTTALALLAIAPAATAFCPTALIARRATPLHATEETDFDAPTPAYPQYATTVLENQPIVDDECYLGKDGTAAECVDFDPPSLPARTTRSVNAQDPTRAPPAWTYADDFDAPVPANPQSGTTVLAGEPVVDDECYMGKDGGYDGCVDFDPPARPNDWTNALDQPMGKSGGTGWSERGAY